MLLSTYRLQLNKDFPFRKVLTIIPYLHQLGISHCYFSPIFKALPGSLHGYDIVDHNQINPEIGSLEEFENLVKILRQHKMGVILDIVPNHMSIGKENKWWMDVLEKGPSSVCADYFDIEWRLQNPILHGKVLLPVLGNTYSNAIQNGEFRFRFDATSDKFKLNYYDQEFPLNFNSYQYLIGKNLDEFNDKNANQEVKNQIHQILESQFYRLAHWQDANDTINYRRFFDVNQLICLKTQNPEVLDATHKLIFALIKKDLIDGLRIDHPDGLHDPAAYFQYLQKKINKPSLFYVIAEKILATNENLPNNWPIQGTTGYDFMNQVGKFFIDSTSENKLTKFYETFTKKKISFDEILYQSKKNVISNSLASELNELTNQLKFISEKNWQTRDFKVRELRAALTEVIACFPVYRTYLSDHWQNKVDKEYRQTAVAAAKKINRTLTISIYDFIEKVLTGNQVLAFVMKLQQYTAPVMAKGMEDTSFYIYNRLISLNEVGGNPREFSLSADDLHTLNQKRQINFPLTLLATSTHDTKRSEDVRMRIHALSEFADLWAREVRAWHKINQHHKIKVQEKIVPDLNEEYFLYQTLVGAWPLELIPEIDSTDLLRVFLKRLDEYMIKALREAKINTSWIHPNLEYEQAVSQFIHKIFDQPNVNPFLKEFLHFQKKITSYGLLNSLSQTLIKLTAPGVPDFYQGQETWNFSMVDPDNRRAVDFEQLKKDSLKTLVITTGLHLRKTNPDIFLNGTYLPLKTAGKYAEHIFAFARVHNKQTVITIVPRLVRRLKKKTDVFPLGETCWENTCLILPNEKQLHKLKNCFTQEIVFLDQATEIIRIKIGKLFKKFPFGLLINF